jgi:hypothetical protein
LANLEVDAVLFVVEDAAVVAVVVLVELLDRMLSVFVAIDIDIEQCIDVRFVF